MADVALADLPAPPPPVSADQLPAPPDAPESGLETTGRAVARGAIEGAMALPELAMDAPVAAANLASRGLEKISGRKPDPDMELPSTAINRTLDRAIAPPKSKAGKIGETAVSLLTPGPGDLAAGLQALPRLAELSPTDLLKLHIDGTPAPESQRVIQDAVNAGFKFPPSELPHAPIGKTIEGLAGKARTDEEASIANNKRTQQLVATEFGLAPETEITDDVIDRLKQPAYGVYQEVADLGPIHPSPGYVADVSKAGERGAQAETDFPDAVSPSILAERAKYIRPQFTGRGALERIKSLRADSKGNISSRDPEKMSLGVTQRDIANALEKELGVAASNSGKQDLMQRFTRARAQLAKINAVDDARVGGQVSARSLAKQYDRGSPLTGNLKTIAQAASRHKQVFKDMQTKGEQGPYTVHDLWIMALGMGLGGEGAVSHMPHGAAPGFAVAAATAARPVARKALLSAPVQRLMTRPKGSRPIERYVKSKGSQAAALGAVNAAAGSPDIGEGSQ